MRSSGIAWRATLTLMLGVVVGATGTARAAHEVNFKSPGPGMHFTAGMPIIVFADIFDNADGHGLVINGVGWPQMQVLVDGVPWKDSVTGAITVKGTSKLDANDNPDPIDFYRFSLVGVPAGAHQLVVRAFYAPPPRSDGATRDCPPLTVVVDPEPAGKTKMVLTADVTGPVTWNNVFVIGNGHVVTASGAVTIKNSLVTGLGSMMAPGISGESSALDLEGSIFENTGSIELSLSGEALVKGNEFRANNLLTFIPSNPDAVPVVMFTGKSPVLKRFQGNRVGAGRVVFHGSDHWLVGGDTDDLSNVVIGPRGSVHFEEDSSDIIFRGNYVHHNYNGGWSQGYNLSFWCTFCHDPGGMMILSEHNFLRGGSWIVQDLTGELRYNVIYGYGHTWVRGALSGASIHHNLFLPEDIGDVNSGLQLYQPATGVQVYNNTFDGGGAVTGDFTGPFVDASGGFQVTSLRNNLFTFTRDMVNGPGKPLVVGEAGSIKAADYNAFFSPDATNKDNYAVADLMEGASPGFASHDVSGAAMGTAGVKDGRLAKSPFAGKRVIPIGEVVDEGAVWAGTQKVSQVLAAFRAAYTPAAGAPVVDSGDPADNDAMGRRADIGAIDLGGHDKDLFGKFGNSGTTASDTTPPTVTLTAPAAGATIKGTTMLKADAMDNAGGSGLVLVQFLVDGAVVGQTAKSPYAISFDSTAVTNAMHSFTAKAWDAASNVAVSAAVMATVSGNTSTTGAGGMGGMVGSTGAGGTDSSGEAGATGDGTGEAGTGMGTAGTTGGSGLKMPPSGCGCDLGGGSSSVWLGLATCFLLFVRARRPAAKRS